MKLKLQNKRTKKKTKNNRQKLAKSILAVAPVRKLVRNKRAISAVLSNMILIAAVIAVGFVALIWSQNQASAYQKQYGTEINSNIIQLKERISLEYASYSGGVLRIYLMNSGPVSVALKSLTISGSVYNITNLYNFDTGAPFGTTTLNATTGQKEGYIQQSMGSLAGSYLIKIETGMGSSFVYTIAI